MFPALVTVFGVFIALLAVTSLAVAASLDVDDAKNIVTVQVTIIVCAFVCFICL